MEEEEFLTAKEVAELLQIRPSSIYNLVKLGRLKRYPIGRRLRFRRTAVEQFMEERKLLTVKEAADLLLVHTSTIHLMVRRGCLKTYPVGKRLCLKREDVHALLGK